MSRIPPPNRSRITDIFSPIFSLCVLLLSRGVSGPSTWRCGKGPHLSHGSRESGGLLSPVQAHHLPSAPGCSTEPGASLEGLGEPPCPCSARSSAHVWGQLCSSHPDKRGLYSGLVCCPFLEFPVFFLPVVGSCQAVAVFVRGQKQRIWTSDMGWGVVRVGGRQGNVTHRRKCH